jgi:hypothetical protein
MLPGAAKEEVVKMGFLFSGLFWGIIVILVGITLVLNVVAGVRIPLFRIVVGLILVYLGVCLIAGGRWGVRSRNSAAFSETKVTPNEAAPEYSILFGKGDIDLSRVTLKPGANRCEVNTVFGGSVVRLDPQMPVRVSVSSAFGGARLPDGSSVSFGDHSYTSPGYRSDSAYLDLKLSVVFGGVEAKNQ